MYVVYDILHTLTSKQGQVCFPKAKLLTCHHLHLGALPKRPQSAADLYPRTDESVSLKAGCIDIAQVNLKIKIKQNKHIIYMCI